MKDSYKTRSWLQVGEERYQIHRLGALEADLTRLPYALKILLENQLRNEDDRSITRDHIDALVQWQPKAESEVEIAFTPSRVILQDFTGVPAIVDLAAMREAMVALGGDPGQINPLSPAELVIDHSVQVDVYGSATALLRNNEIEFKRNRERYAFLRWGQQTFNNFAVVPPNTGIVHQVNLEYLARVVFVREHEGARAAYPDTLVGTDSHTTMINGLGVLGWGVGGIEAEAAMLGQPVTMLIPQVIGFRLTGHLAEGATATDLVLTVTQMLRAKGVVGKFVEFFGDGLDQLPLADRATIGNMAPEFGSTCAVFPIDEETLRYLELSGRDQRQIALVQAYAREQGLWRDDATPDPDYSDVLELDLGTVEPSLAGPRRPQDRIPLREVKRRFAQLLAPQRERRAAKSGTEARFEDEGGDTAVGHLATAGGLAMLTLDGQTVGLRDGAVLIAAITSCTNTSNPAVMVGAALLARNAVAKGLIAKPWVKTSLAPGSRVVTDYLQRAGLLEGLEALGFFTVGYGCTTCIGNSGPLRSEIAQALATHDIVGCSVLSGNRNFEGRIHPQVRMNFLASPPLVVAYALAGTMDIDLYQDPLGQGNDGQAVQEVVAAHIDAGVFSQSYEGVFAGDAHWNALEVPAGERFAWDERSTYIRKPPYFEGLSLQPEPVADISGARVLALLGDTVTTDHVSPAGSIASDSPAARYLIANGVAPVDFNSYGSRRGNHEVMMRGTFANIRLRNRLVPQVEGGFTLHVPSREQMSIYDAAMRYREEGTPLIVIAGAEYGTGSSRDWAAKGTLLLGVRAVIAQSFERIHRSNLIGMGVLPLQFIDGASAESLGLTGMERYDILGLHHPDGKTVQVTATPDSGAATRFPARVRIDTPKERDYFSHGGILHYVLRQLAARPEG